MISIEQCEACCLSTALCLDNISLSENIVGHCWLSRITQRQWRNVVLRIHQRFVFGMSCACCCTPCFKIFSGNLGKKLESGMCDNMNLNDSGVTVTILSCMVLVTLDLCSKMFNPNEFEFARRNVFVFFVPF